MTKILIVNPNAATSMTSAIGSAARAAASSGVEVHAVDPGEGPLSIEGYVDEAYSVPGLLDTLAAWNGRADAAVIACFDDTGLDAARCVFAGPVVGIGEAGFHMASLVAGSFGVVTTLSRSVPAIEHNLTRYGLAARCRKVRASEVPVLDLEKPESGARAKISAEIERCIATDGAEAVVLGCAGMADLASSLSAKHGVPVIDGVACAVRLAESLVALGLATSRVGGYREPAKKAYLGRFADVPSGFGTLGPAERPNDRNI